MELYSDDDRLIAELRDLRPTPSTAFVAELDERAATGFPRRSRLRGSSLGALISSALGRMRSASPRRTLLPVAAISLTAVVVATVVVTNGENGPGKDSPPLSLDRSTSSLERSTELDSGGAGGKAATPREGDARASSGTEFEGESSVGADQSAAAANASGGGRRVASPAANRDVERSAELTLGTDPTGVADAASRVFDTVHAYDGIVLRSSTREGEAGEAGAEFELLIPSGRLSDALADLSRISDVLSRHDVTKDITAATVTAGEQLRDSRARIDSLLLQLAETDTESEREAVETELRSERRRAAALRAKLSRLDQRVSLSRVKVRIEGGASATGTDTPWGFGDAVQAAGRILSIAAAVTLVGLAILGPLALIALLTRLARRTWLRRSRQRALG